MPMLLQEACCQKNALATSITLTPRVPVKNVSRIGTCLTYPGNPTACVEDTLAERLRRCLQADGVSPRWARSHRCRFIWP